MPIRFWRSARQTPTEETPLVWNEPTLVLCPIKPDPRRVGLPPLVPGPGRAGNLTPAQAARAQQTAGRHRW